MIKKKRIAILTNFMEFNPGYSLTGIVVDQAKMLQQFGHEVHIFVNEKFNASNVSSLFPPFTPEDKERGMVPINLHQKIPFAHLKDYTSINDVTPEHLEVVKKTEKVLLDFLKPGDVIFTHDFLFTGWFLPYGMGCIETSRNQEVADCRWFHWVHSVPSASRDWWRIQGLRPNHKIVYPNATDRLRVAEQYHGAIEDVVVIPHIKDPRTWFEFDSETCAFVWEFPKVLSADVVQIYPASSDRLTAKRVDVIIKMFAQIKASGKSVCLVIANQWATGRNGKENVDKYLKIAKRCGLIPHEEVIFTSMWCARYETGIPRGMLNKLFVLSNLFIFPTREESFGLVAPEAAMSGVLMVLNKSLCMQAEVNGGTGLYFDFGSYHMHHQPSDENQYYSDVVQVILGSMHNDNSLTAKTHARVTYNWDAIYRNYYLPVIGSTFQK
jgi:glycosyltransferase involved in cell wall biosynthesis